MSPAERVKERDRNPEPEASAGNSSGTQTLNYATNLATAAQTLADDCWGRLAAVSLAPAEGLENRTACMPAAPYFRDLFTELIHIDCALESIRAALDAVDV